jgi:o-succinylbenzoate---CoA ligase
VLPWIDSAASRRPDHPALIAGHETLTWSQLAERAGAVSAALAAQGVGEGDRVAIALRAGIDFAATLHGCLRLGAVAVPIDLRLGEAERKAIAARASLIVDRPTPNAQRPTPDHAVLTDDAHAMVIHTSGTTDAPRPITLTHGNWAAHAWASAAALGHPTEERWLCCLPLSHVGGLGILVRAAIHATTVLLHERFDAGVVATALHESVTGVSLVPTMLGRVLDAGLECPPLLRVALIGGGPMPPGMLRRALDAGIPVAQTYGLTEACSQVTAEEPREASGTAGRPLHGVELALDAGGEILVRGPTVAPGSVDDDGFLHTGDLGVLDRRGRLTVVGRRGETIVSGGENVAPAEVEAALESHPAVSEVAVFGRPDPEWGERVVAAVVLREGSTAASDDLRAHAAARLARYKVPKEVELHPALPRTASGKVRRAELR